MMMNINILSAFTLLLAVHGTFALSLRGQSDETGPRQLKDQLVGGMGMGMMVCELQSVDGSASNEIITACKHMT